MCRCMAGRAAAQSTVHGCRHVVVAAVEATHAAAAEEVQAAAAVAQDTPIPWEVGVLAQSTLACGPVASSARQSPIADLQALLDYAAFLQNLIYGPSQSLDSGKK